MESIMEAFLEFNKEKTITHEVIQEYRKAVNNEEDTIEFNLTQVEEVIKQLIDMNKHIKNLQRKYRRDTQDKSDIIEMLRYKLRNK